MTRYVVTAWCVRPVFAECEVEADTPQEALALAREAILDAPAEECDRDDDDWNEWRVDTDQSETVLCHLDESASLRGAAAELLEACRMVVERWERGDLADAARACVAAIASAEGRTAP